MAMTLAARLTQGPHSVAPTIITMAKSGKKDRPKTTPVRDTKAFLARFKWGSFLGDSAVRRHCGREGLSVLGLVWDDHTDFLVGQLHAAWKPNHAQDSTIHGPTPSALEVVWQSSLFRFLRSRRPAT